MLAPIAGELRKIIEKRINQNEETFGNPFTLSTKLSLKSLFNCILNGEVDIEALRKNLRNLNSFSPRAIFDKIALSGRSGLNERDVILIYFR